MHRAFLSFIALASVACGGILPTMEPPPPTPERVEPQIEDLPTTPPSTGLGRIVLDANGEPAKVTRVAAVLNFEPRGSANLQGKTSLAPPRLEEPICVAPCALDIRHGSHSFVFSSLRDPTKSSVVDVTVPSKPSTLFVRHAIGKEGHFTGGYVGGAMLGLVGMGGVMMGGGLTILGLAAGPTPRDDGTVFDPKTLVAPGLVILGVGLATMLLGGYLMSENRPVRQAGSTTTWTKPATPEPASSPEVSTPQ